MEVDAKKSESKVRLLNRHNFTWMRLLLVRAEHYMERLHYLSALSIQM